jgi:AsmA protein
VRILKWTGGVVAALVLLAILFLAFGLNALKGPLARQVSAATGRELVIDGNLRAVWSWVHPRFRAEGVSFANAEWGRAEHLFKAEALEASISFLPLFAGRVVVPDLHLERPHVSLEQTADGRKNWILKDEVEPREESRFHIQRLTLDHGLLDYVDAGRAIDLTVDLSTDEAGVGFSAVGSYERQEFSAAGHAGHVLSLRDETTPFPLKGEAAIGKTHLKVDGTLTGIVGLKQIDSAVELSGASMDDLYGVIGVALPSTPPYVTKGRLVRNDGLVRYQDFTGKVGESDIAGAIEVDVSGERPFMKGDLRSKVLNLADLGVLVGTQQPRKDGVLPDAPFQPDRWGSVDADVKIAAGTIKRPEQLPIENLSARIQMRERVLTLDPMAFGIAGGKLAGPIRLDGSSDTIRADLKMRIQGVQLSKLFPTIKQNQGSVGSLSGLIELKGSGNSVGLMLATASGSVGAYMDGGRISRFMMELVALDLWDAARVKLKGDEPIDIRCAIADFGVKNGMMSTNAFVFDTSVVLVEGAGTVNLKNEAMDLKLNPKPKDSSIASLNSPLFVTGTFSDPKVAPDMGKLAAKGVGAIVMGIINPVLAILPLFKEGKGEDSNCAALIANATAGGSKPPAR